MNKPSQIEKQEAVYCVIPRELAGKLLESLRAFYATDDRVWVIVDRRATDRRMIERRAPEPAADALQPPTAPLERRVIQNRNGRRVGNNRADLVPAPNPPPLPRKAHIYTHRIHFLRHRAVGADILRALDDKRLILRFQNGDRRVAFDELYRRNLDRVYTYFCMALGDSHEAEDLTQEVFLRVSRSLDGFDVNRGTPFVAWLMQIAKNRSSSFFAHGNPEWELREPADLQALLDRKPAAEDQRALDWTSDFEAAGLMSKLPKSQRQILFMRYLIGLSWSEIADALGKEVPAVRQSGQRAMKFLREHLTSSREKDPQGTRYHKAAMCRSLNVLRARRFALQGQN